VSALAPLVPYWYRHLALALVLMLEMLLGSAFAGAAKLQGCLAALTLQFEHQGRRGCHHAGAPLLKVPLDVILLQTIA
jgi:hypothetical protein